MRRRAFLTSLFTAAGMATLANPAQARGRRRGGYRMRRMGYRRRRSSYQSVSYPSRRQSTDQTVSTGVSQPVAQAVPGTQTRSNQPLIDRKLPEFWKSPGEIDRPIVAKLQEQDIRGLDKTQLTRKFGPPMRDEDGSLTWNVGRTSDGIVAPQTFTVYINHGKASRFQRGF